MKHRLPGVPVEQNKFSPLGSQKFASFSQNLVHRSFGPHRRADHLGEIVEQLKTGVTLMEAGEAPVGESRHQCDHAEQDDRNRADPQHDRGQQRQTDVDHGGDRSGC